MNERLSIETPENIVLNADIAGYGTRCVAAIIDYLFVLLLILFASYLFVRAIPPGNRNDTQVVAILIGIQFLIITFYHLLFELLWNGQTPGKRSLNIRVVQANGLPVTASNVIIRNLVRLFDFMPLFYGVGLIVMFVSKNTQRLGDLAARTVVVREKRQLTLNTLKQDWRIAYFHVNAITPIPPYIQIDMLTLEDRQVVVDYLRRRGDLRDRTRLAWMLANKMAAKMNTESPRFGSERDAETFLEYIARAFEVRDSA